MDANLTVHDVVAYRLLKIKNSSKTTVALVGALVGLLGLFIIMYMMSMVWQSYTPAERRRMWSMGGAKKKGANLAAAANNAACGYGSAGSGSAGSGSAGSGSAGSGSAGSGSAGSSAVGVGSFVPTHQPIASLPRSVITNNNSSAVATDSELRQLATYALTSCDDARGNPIKYVVTYDDANVYFKPPITIASDNSGALCGLLSTNAVQTNAQGQYTRINLYLPF